MEAPRTQLEVPESAGRLFGVRWILALVIAATICGGALRLVGIDRIGLKGSDNTNYTNIGRHWSENDRVLAIGDTRTIYRPVAYATYAAAIRLFGYNDWSIKIVNASLDTLNILLVFLLAYILSRRDPWVASSAAVIYALLPFTILISRNELTHILSTSMLLMAMILLSLSRFAKHRAAMLGLMFLAGVATGLCALTHEEMIFTAAAPSLFLLLTPPNRSEGIRARLIEAVSSAGSYLFGILLVAHGMLQAHQTDAQIRATEIVGHRVTEAHYLRFVGRPLKFGWNAMTGSSSTILTCLVIIFVLVLITRFALGLKHGLSGSRAPRLQIEDLPLWTVAIYLVLYSFFFSYYAVRLFVPLIPLVIIWLIVRSASLSTQFTGRQATRGFLVVLTITTVAANLGHIHTFSYSMASRSQTWSPFSPATDSRLDAGWSTLRTELTKTTWNRRLFEELGRVVNKDSRLLVGASTLHPFPGRRSLQIGYYFGDNAVYLFDHDEPLDELIREKKIEFVLFTAFQAVDRPAAKWGEWQRYRYEGRWGPREPPTLGKSVGIADGEYTITGEFDLLRADMVRRGAHIILGHRELLIKKPTWSDNTSYVVWVLDPKNWPPLENEIEVTSRSLELASEGRLAEALATLDAADTTGFQDMGRFRLQIAAAAILAEHDRPGKARRRVADALSQLPRDTTMSTALIEAFPTRPATEETYELFADLQATKPKNRAFRDLLLATAVNLAEFAIEEDDRAGSIDAFWHIEYQLQIPGSRKMTLAIADWCASTCRELARDGRAAEARSCLAAKTTAEQLVRRAGQEPSIFPGTLPPS